MVLGVNLDTTLLHHLDQITVADAVLAVPAHAQQEDLDRKAAALEQGQKGGSLTNRPSLYR
jgi:D-ribose pyranose/furanose isomerase RbsD